MDARGTQQTGDSATLMLTDIEGSTHIIENLGIEYPKTVARVRQLLRESIGKHKGVELDVQGDASFAAFRTAADAVRAAIEIQRRIHAQDWGTPLRIRIGVHTGQPQVVGNSYYGLDVHRTARIAAAGSGGQILISAATRAQLSEGDLAPEIAVRDLGSHRLKDLQYPELLFDLCIPELPTNFKALRSLDSQPNNLPMAETTFIGRQRELRHVCDLLRRPDTRLLTLTGTGGTGKTRLAIESARALLPNFSHGVFLVSLASVSDPTLLDSVILQTIGLADLGKKTPLESLIHHLGQRETLLVLDNFEQILPAAVKVGELLSGCPRLKILATSRECLNIRWERECPVWPLQVPEAVEVTVDGASASESVRLFVDRVQAYDDEFTLTSANVDAVCAICRRLDGLPLALELAASWLRLYTPGELLERLENSIDLLTEGPRDLAGHQQTLKDTITWSYNLLSRVEQTVFRRLSVFMGGSTLHSAIEISSDAETSGANAVHIMSLVRKNLVVHTNVEGESRLRMLETIRQFGKRVLETSQENGSVHRRHAEHYLSLAESMATGVTGRQQRRFVTKLIAEQDNLRGALEWAMHTGDAQMASRFLTALLWFWIPRAHFAEGRAWANKASDAFDRLGYTREVALIHEAKGFLEVLSGNYETGLQPFQRSYDIFATLPDPIDRARSTVTLAVTCLVLGDDRGPALSEDALTLSETVNDDFVRALALLCAGIRHYVSGNLADAASFYSQSLLAFSRADNVFWPGQVLQNLARLRLAAGDHDGAAKLACEALGLGREYDYPMIRNLSLAVMGAIALAKGTPELGAQLLGAVDASLGGLDVTFEPPEDEAMQNCIEATKATLGDAFDVGFQQGRRWREPEILRAVQSLHGGAFS